jgi:hypothetical protein
MSTLNYRPFAERGALNRDECLILPATNGQARWWMLHYRVLCNDGRDADFCTPINPNGPNLSNGPGGKTWGLNRAEPGAWQVSPSIAIANPIAHEPGEPAELWHQTPKIVGVPEGEPWQAGPP